MVRDSKTARKSTLVFLSEYIDALIFLHPPKIRINMVHAARHATRNRAAYSRTGSAGLFSIPRRRFFPFFEASHAAYMVFVVIEKHLAIVGKLKVPPHLTPSGMRQICHPFAPPKDLATSSVTDMPALHRTNRAGSPEKRPASPGDVFLDSPRLFLYNEGKIGDRI